MYAQGYTSLCPNSMPERSDFGISSSLKSPLCGVPNGSLGWLLCSGWPCEDVSEWGPCQGCFPFPLCVCPSAPGGRCTVPPDRRISCIPNLLGGGVCVCAEDWAAGRAMKSGCIAWEWKSCPGVHSSIPHSSLLHSSQMSSRNLPRRNSCLMLKRGNTESSWSFKPGGLMSFLPFGNRCSV